MLRCCKWAFGRRHGGRPWRTCLSIDDPLMAHLKREAARQGRTMSDLAETALRLLSRARRSVADLPDLPTLRSGGLVATERHPALPPRSSPTCPISQATSCTTPTRLS